MKRQEKGNLPYEEAFTRLQALVEEMESEQISVDELVPKLKEAVALAKACKAKLHEAEKEVSKILSGLPAPLPSLETAEEET